MTNNNILTKCDYTEFKQKSPHQKSWAINWSNNKNIKIDAEFIEKKAKQDYKQYLLYKLSDGKYFEIEKPRIDGQVWYRDDMDAPQDNFKNFYYNNERNRKTLKIESAEDINNRFYFIKHYCDNNEVLSLQINVNRCSTWGWLKDDYIKRGVYVREATAEEVKAIAAEYGAINNDFYNRLKKYYKRYGAQYNSYWADR